MSLLMDALKKAEEEKKKAAEAGQALSLDDATLVQEPQEQPATPAYEDTHTLSGEHGDTLPEGEGLTLEPIPGTALETGFASEPEPGSGDIHDRTETLSPEAHAELLADYEHGGTRSGEHTGEGTGTYDGDETVPSERTIHSSLKDYFEASQSINSDTLSGIHAVAAEADEAGTGVTDTTHVTAQTVFSASAHKRQGSTFVWVGSAIILLLLLGGGGAWYYLELMPGASHGNTGIANRNPGPAVVPAPVPESQARPQPGPVVAAQPAPPAMNPPEVAMAMPESMSVESMPMPAPATSDLGEAEIPPYARLDQTVVVPHQQAVPTPKATVAATVPVPALQEKLPAPPVHLKIRKVRSGKALDKGLKQAYAAYQSGDTASAARLYRDVLKRRPRQRDALLGLAAIALAQGDRQLAWLRYREVLRNNPADPVASAALFSISGGVEGSPVSASRLKLLLDRHPRAAYLHFALGSLYARQQRWAAAQQSYFAAYRSDSNNPDYAYNLAVSLDHLQQSGAALDYYHKAMALAGQGTVSFNTARVLARIQALSSLKNPS